MSEVKALYAKATSKPDRLSKAIILNVVNFNHIEVHAMGEAAIAKTVKAIAVAKGFFEPGKHEIVCKIDFTKVGEFSGIKFQISKVKRSDQFESKK